MKKFIALLLTIAMAASLCACGQSSSTSSGSTSTSGTNAAEEATPDYVYKSTFSTLAQNTRVNYIPELFTEDGIYATGDEIVGSKAPEGVEEDYFGQYDITEPRIYFIDYSGKVTKLENYTPVPADEAGEGQYDFQCYNYISGLNIDPDGNIWVLETSSQSYVDTDELTEADEDYYDHYFWDMKYYLRELDPTGTEISTSTFQMDDGSYIYSQCTLDKDGNILATKSTEDGENSLIALNGSGEVVYEIPTGDDYIMSLISDTDGTVYATMWGDYGTVMRPLDSDAKAFGDSISLPDDASTVIMGGGDYKLYYTSGVNFYGFNPGDEEPTKLFNWMDCDINPDTSYNVYVSPTGVVRTIVSDFDNYNMVYNIDLAQVEKVPYDAASAKQELTLATQYLDYDLENTVINFNRKHDDIRIKVIDYSEYNTEDDYTAGQQKLSTEIIAGNSPDIIALSGMPVSQFAAKGVLEDLYPYIDADPDIDLNDYYENIIKAGEYDGKLVRTVTSFGLYTAVGASQLVGDTPGWTYEQFDEALKTLQDSVEDATAFDSTTTRANILSTCLCLDMQDFVNWSTGEVNFNNDEFYSLLKFAKSFPTDFDWEEYDYQNDSAESRISQGKQLLWRDTVSNTNSLMYLESCFNGADITFIGYPTNNGIGNMITLDSGYAMSTNCSNKDAAWEFLRQMFTPEYYYQYASYSGLSPIKSVLQKSIKEATTVKYQIDDNGQYVLDDNGDRIPEPKYYAINTDMYEYYALSQSVADAFLDAVDNCTKVYDYNSSIIDIVSEEAEAYFQGQKSAEDVAKLIQSKVNIYVNEQR